MVEEDATGSEGPKSIAKVTIKGPDIDITRSVDEKTMGSIIGLLFGVPATSGSGGGGGGGAGGGSNQGRQQQTQWDEEITLGEFISDTGASTFQHKICAAGYYLM